LSGIAGVIATTATLVLASYWVSVIAAKLLAMGASFAVTNCTETGLVESSSCGTGNSILRASRGDDVEAQHVARRNANPLDYFKALSIGTSLCVFCSDWWNISDNCYRLSNANIRDVSAGRPCPSTPNCGVGSKPYGARIPFAYLWAGSGHC